jgi:hypothetical protein
MTPQTNPPDPAFEIALSTSIRGIFAVELDRFTPQFVEIEYRKIVRQPDLVSNDGIMDNLMFVVRKKDILVLRPDVVDTLRGQKLKPHAELSALKTLYALGSEQDRLYVDDYYAHLLAQDVKSNDGLSEGPLLAAASPIGGQRTLLLLKGLLPEATARQRDAEEHTPANHVRIASLDQVRSSISNQIVVLTRKQTILNAPEPRRTLELFRLARTDSSPFGLWAYRELIDHPSVGRVAAIRQAIFGEQPVPPDALSILQAMKAPMSAEEDEILKKRSPPPPDWEAVLDRQ